MDPILILRGMLVFSVYGHGKRNGSRARAPYDRRIHDILTRVNFRPASSQWRARNRVSLLMRVAQATPVAVK